MDTLKGSISLFIVSVTKFQKLETLNQNQFFCAQEKNAYLYTIMISFTFQAHSIPF